MRGPGVRVFACAGFRFLAGGGVEPALLTALEFVDSSVRGFRGAGGLRLGRGAPG